MLPTWTLVQDEGLTAQAGNPTQNGAAWRRFSWVVVAGATVLRYCNIAPVLLDRDRTCLKVLNEYAMKGRTDALLADEIRTLRRLDR